MGALLPASTPECCHTAAAVESQVAGGDLPKGRVGGCSGICRIPTAVEASVTRAAVVVRPLYWGSMNPQRRAAVLVGTAAALTIPYIAFLLYFSLRFPPQPLARLVYRRSARLVYCEYRGGLSDRQEDG